MIHTLYTDLLETCKQCLTMTSCLHVHKNFHQHAVWFITKILKTSRQCRFLQIIIQILGVDNLSKHKCKSAFSLACLLDSYFSLNSFLSCTWRLTPAFMPLVASFASDSSLTDSLGSDTDTDKLRTESSFVQQV